MTWVAVNKDGTELISQEPLKRDFVSKRWFSFRLYADGKYYPSYIELPKGSIKKLIGRELTWKDESVKYTT